MKRICVALAMMLTLPVWNGCASVSTAPPDSAEAETAFAFEPVEDRGVVYLYRRGRMVGAAGSTQIQVNGNTAGGTGPGTFFRWELKPGTYSFSANTSESSATVQVNVEAGEIYFVEQIERLGVQSGRVQIKIQDEKTGKANVKGLKLLVSAYVPD